LRKKLAVCLVIGGMALTGIARANTIVTESFTGRVTSGGAHNGIDVGGYFGAVNASLVGETVSFSFAYDATKLGAGGLYLTGTQYESYVFESDPSAASQTMTIHGVSVTGTPGAVASAGGSGFLPGCAADLYAGVRDTDNSQLEIDLCGTSYAYGTGIPLSQAAVDGYASGVTNAVLYLFNGHVQDILYVTDVVRATPEPATWLSALSALGAAILLQRRKA
jgi:hypothetical protein